jgi:rhodanese-related sulfurtransferase
MMKRESYKSLVKALNREVEAVLPWDLIDERQANPDLLLVDIRCPHEFEEGHISDSINVPRGILEIAADYGYEETVPCLVAARDKRVVVICRSGNRSILAAHTLRMLGFNNVASLRTGVRGWTEYEQDLVDNAGALIHPDDAEQRFIPRITLEQLGQVAV